MEPGPIRARLALMMFGQYLILGAWAVPLASYLLEQPSSGGLGFTPGQTSWIYSTTAIAALLTPLIMGLLADRLFATQKLLGFLNILGAGLLFLTARYCSQQQTAIREAVDPAVEIQRTFTLLMVFMFANSMVLILTLSLCNVTGFRNLREPKKSYGLIRLYGTVAWIIINMSIDFLGEPMSAQPLYVAAIASMVVGLYSFTLPHTPPSRLGKGIGEAIGLPALKMFHRPSFRILIICALCMSAIQQFYGVYANPYLRDLGAFKPMALQTMAQASEVVCLIFFPVVLIRYGFKVTLGIGIDSAIHYLFRYEDEVRRGGDGDLQAALQRTSGSIGTSIFYTALTSVVGFGVLALSEFRPNAYFGVLTGLAMIAALFAILTLLPVLVAATGLFRKRAGLPPLSPMPDEPKAPPPPTKA